MNVLVATSLSQGTREDDYHWCVEGELVTIQEPCACDRIHPESGCGCSRGFAGLSSQRATTTARIAEIPGFTVGDYVAALASGLSAQGWDSADAEGIAEDQLALIAGWPTGRSSSGRTTSSEFGGVHRRRTDLRADDRRAAARPRGR